MGGGHSPDKLIDIALAQARSGVMSTAHIDLCKYVFKARVVSLLIDVVHATGDLEISDHLFDIGVDRQCVCLAGRFEDKVACPCNPIVLEISPASFEYVAEDGGRVAMAAENASSSNTQ